MYHEHLYIIDLFYSGNLAFRSILQMNGFLPEIRYFFDENASVPLSGVPPSSPNVGE